MIDREAEWLEAWRALADRLVEWERVCHECDDDVELVFDSDDQAHMAPRLGGTRA